MRERALGEAQRNEAQSQVPASDFGCFFVRGVLQGNLAPRGRGGGQRAVGRTDPSAQARGARTAGASGGRVGERKIICLFKCFFIDLSERAP